MQEELVVGLWNVKWASRESKYGAFFVERLAALTSDVLCVTEGLADVLPVGGHIVTSEADYGYPLKPGRRKVLLWSRNPWRDVDSLGSEGLPSGRFVAGTTDTPCGMVRFVGVCIPWQDAHVRTGHRNRKPWEDHLAYLQHLPPALQWNETPLILLGDFNQRIPQMKQPEHVFSALTAAMPERLKFATSGSIVGATGQSIDHLAFSEPLNVVKVEYLSQADASGALTSDHFGLRVVLRRAS